jgi:short subunit dehydrogenase-like uncharacterized protein
MEWMIYGANGYTGALIAREAKRRGSAPILAGRAAAKITELARELGLPSRVFSLDEPLAIAAALQGAGLVLNCAGPFSKTADLMMRACLAAKAHYLDITGEIDVLEGVHRYDADAKSAGVILCPGVGFDVTPTDCIVLMLKTALPEAHELALGFESDHRMSPGTAKTLVEGLGKSGKIRRGGRLIDLPIGRGCRDIDFGRGPKRRDAHSLGRRRLSLLHHGHFEHHRLYAGRFAAFDDGATDECVWLHFAFASRSNLAHREDRKNRQRTGCRGARCKPDMAMGASEGP